MPRPPLVAATRGRPPTRAAATWGRGERERGSVSLELAILFPVVLLLVFAIVEYGLWFHARSLALVAAQEGVTAARIYQADPGAGTARARAFLDEHADDGTLSDITVTTTSAAGQQVRIEVQGRSLSVLPGAPGILVTQFAEGPIERFTTAGSP